jgi:hypothetical protein
MLVEDRSMPRRRPTLRSDLLLTIFVVLIQAGAILGCFNSANRVTPINHPDTTYPAYVTITSAFDVPIADAWRNAKERGVPWFVSTSTLLWIAVIVFGRRPMARGWLLVACLIVPFLVDVRAVLAGPFLAILAPLGTPAYLSPTGELIEDGQITIYAAGWWWMLCTVLLIRHARRCRASAMSCGSCGYDMHGIPGPNCPECGQSGALTTR